MAPVTRLPPGQPPRKAPKDAGELVREAQDKLRLALQVGSLRNDPLLPLFEYLGADLNARYQLSVESDEAVNRLSTEGVAKLLTAVPSEEQFERWIRQALADHARGWLRRLDKLNIAAVCGLMLVCGLIGFAAVVKYRSARNQACMPGRGHGCSYGCVIMPTDRQRQTHCALHRPTS